MSGMQTVLEKLSSASSFSSRDKVWTNVIRHWIVVDVVVWLVAPPKFRPRKFVVAADETKNRRTKPDRRKQIVKARGKRERRDTNMMGNLWMDRSLGLANGAFYEHYNDACSLRLSSFSLFNKIRSYRLRKGELVFGRPNQNLKSH